MAEIEPGNQNTSFAAKDTCMKTPNFWYKPRGLASAALLPLTLFWRAGTAIRRVMATPYHARIPVICTGNVVAGGAGKTPLAITIAHMLLAKGKQPIFVTRGYGGTERGPLRVDPARHTAKDVGDEALLLARTAPVWIGRNRAAAIRAAEPHATHIILDDGLQNPSVLPDLAFLVIDGTVGFGNECVIPAGPLRESFKSVMTRITAIILIGDDAGRNIAVRAQCPILRAQWQADLPENFPRTQKFFAFAGIARPEKFYETCRRAELDLAGTKNFPDHHMFSAKDRAGLQAEAASLGARLLTTEKDFVRLPLDFRAQVTPLPAKLVFDEVGTLAGMLDKI